MVKLYEKIFGYCCQRGPAALDNLDQMIERIRTRFPELSTSDAYRMVRAAYNEAHRDQEVDA